MADKDQKITDPKLEDSDDLEDMDSESDDDSIPAEDSDDSDDDSEEEVTHSTKSVLKSTRGGDESKADATRLYLKEIGFSPLLSAEEEVFYARRKRVRKRRVDE